MEEQLNRGKNPRGLDAAFDLVSSFANDPERADRYPNGTTFIASDLPDVTKLMAQAVEEKRPFTVIYPRVGLAGAAAGGPRRHPRRNFSRLRDCVVGPAGSRAG